MPDVLAVDLGKTLCRCSLSRSDGTTTSATGPGAPGLADPEGVAGARRAVAAVTTGLLDGLRPSRAGFGVAGAAAAPTGAVAELARLLGLDLGSAEVAVTSDATTSHAGALDGQAGVVLAAGTGAVAVGVGLDGRYAQVDGVGSWLGDEGSGAWIGRAGLAAALRAGDGRGPSTTLAGAAADSFGIDLRQLPGAVAGPEVARLSASFAPSVADAARNADPVAAAVLTDAALALARSVVAAARAIASPGVAVPVALTGGLLGLGPVLLDPLHAALADADVALELRAPAGDALQGAWLLATRSDTVHEPRVARFQPAVAR